MSMNIIATTVQRLHDDIDGISPEMQDDICQRWARSAQPENSAPLGPELQAAMRELSSVQIPIGIGQDIASQSFFPNSSFSGTSAGPIASDTTDKDALVASIYELAAMHKANKRTMKKILKAVKKRKKTEETARSKMVEEFTATLVELEGTRKEEITQEVSGTVMQQTVNIQDFLTVATSLKSLISLVYQDLSTLHSQLKLAQPVRTVQIQTLEITLDATLTRIGQHVTPFTECMSGYDLCSDSSCDDSSSGSSSSNSSNSSSHSSDIE